MLTLLGVLDVQKGCHIFVSFNKTELEIKIMQCKLIKERQVSAVSTAIKLAFIHLYLN